MAIPLTQAHSDQFFLDYLLSLFELDIYYLLYIT